MEIIISVDFCAHHNHYHPFGFPTGSIRQSNRDFTHPTLICDDRDGTYLKCMESMQRKRDLLEEVYRYAVHRP